MAQELTINQISTVLNEVVGQATGRTDLATLTTDSLISVANISLKTGYDPLLQAVSQVLSRTIFSVRPYYAKFKGLMVDNVTFGNHVRKLQVADKDAENDERLPLNDKQSIDMYKVSKPDVLQTNFYGQSTWQRHITLFRDQLDTAFRSVDEFGRFVSMVMQNVSDIREQEFENLARITVANQIAGILDEASETRVIKVLTEYNNLTGLSLTAQSVYEPENYKGFIQWLYSKIATISEMMTERSSLYQTIITGHNINRHTPKKRQRIYLYAPATFQIAASVLANTFNTEFLKYGDAEVVNYWQSIKDPDSINITPTYIDNKGEEKIGSNIEQSNVLAIISDVEAMGQTNVNNWSAPTPFNAAGGYSNVFFHTTTRYWNDFTEKAVVLLME